MSFSTKLQQHKTPYHSIQLHHYSNAHSFFSQSPSYPPVLESKQTFIPGQWEKCACKNVDL